MTNLPILLLLAALWSLLGGVFIARFTESTERPGTRTLRACILVSIFVVLAGAEAWIVRQNSSVANMILVPAGVLFGSLVYRPLARSSTTSEVGLRQERVRALMIRHGPAVGTALGLALFLPLIPLSNEPERFSEPPLALETPSIFDTIEFERARPDTGTITLKVRALVRAEASKNVEDRSGALEGLAETLAPTIAPALPAAFKVQEVAMSMAKGFLQAFSEGLGDKAIDGLAKVVGDVYEHARSRWRAKAHPTRPGAVAPTPEQSDSPRFVIRFDHGDASPSQSGLNVVSEIVKQQRNKYTLVLLLGSADRSGEAGKNFELARNRAMRIQTLLVTRGIAPFRVVAWARDEQSVPILTQDGVLEPENRRVDIWILGEDSLSNPR